MILSMAVGVTLSECFKTVMISFISHIVSELSSLQHYRLWTILAKKTNFERHFIFCIYERRWYIEKEKEFDPIFYFFSLRYILSLLNSNAYHLNHFYYFEVHMLVCIARY